MGHSTPRVLNPLDSFEGPFVRYAYYNILQIYVLGILPIFNFFMILGLVLSFQFGPNIQTGFKQADLELPIS